MTVGEGVIVGVVVTVAVVASGPVPLTCVAVAVGVSCATLLAVGVAVLTVVAVRVGVDVMVGVGEDVAVAVGVPGGTIVGVVVVSAGSTPLPTATIGYGLLNGHVTTSIVALAGAGAVGLNTTPKVQLAFVPINRPVHWSLTTVNGLAGVMLVKVNGFVRLATVTVCGALAVPIT